MVVFFFFDVSKLGLKVDIIKLDFPPGYPDIQVFLGSTPGNSNLSIPVQPYVWEREEKRRWEEPFSGNEKTFSPPVFASSLLSQRGKGKQRRRRRRRKSDLTLLLLLFREKKKLPVTFFLRARNSSLSFKICEIALLKMPSSLFQVEYWREESGTMAEKKRNFSFPRLYC